MRKLARKPNERSDVGNEISLFYSNGKVKQKLKANANEITEATARKFNTSSK